MTQLDDFTELSHFEIDRRAAAAVLGHASAPDAVRGVFRSSDGGRSWQKVFFLEPGLLDSSPSRRTYEEENEDEEAGAGEGNSGGAASSGGGRDYSRLYTNLELRPHQ